MLKFQLSVFIIFVVALSAFSQSAPLSFDPYIKERNGLKYASYAIAVKKEATVAFLGGSITYNPGWRDSVCNYLKSKFPATKFHFIAAGIPSLGSLPHSFRLKRDVLDSGKVDLLFLEAAVNDQVNGTDSLTQVKALEGIVRHAKKNNPFMDIIMMSFADPDKTKLYNNGIIPLSILNHELVAGHYGLTSINLAKAVRDKIENKEFNWDDDFKDLHPSPFGQNLYFKGIERLLNQGLVIPAHKKTQRRALPKSLNMASFSNGSYYSISHAIYDKDWQLNPSWTPKDGLGTREGFVNVPMLTSEKEGATLTLIFKGNAIGMAVVSGADAGIVGYSIDGGPEREIDLYTEWSSYLHLPWYVLLGDDLSDVKHTLKLNIKHKKNIKSTGTACRIVQFLVNSK